MPIYIALQRHESPTLARRKTQGALNFFVFATLALTSFASGF